LKALIDSWVEQKEPKIDLFVSTLFAKALSGQLSLSGYEVLRQLQLWYGPRWARLTVFDFMKHFKSPPPPIMERIVAAIWQLHKDGCRINESVLYRVWEASGHTGGSTKWIGE
jgi:hypothetical protein